ncbi:kinase domain-containing protein [Penicillium psychrosexuale]|uniref:kinase domain-containing protein n=1 Tax=Penicillium psychrosexuale TaxID=1002107 RepID=UPI0025456823|nr:kinase domain-containing protein [Penicillium psychrosexuale]KAJ5795896.1 kinase domain-containing protein [Penicillium psychrosexuale]
MTGIPLVPDGPTDFGDFVRNEDEELDLEEAVEPWHKYDVKATPEVFYPIRLGEVLNERYLIEHKLGFGGGSTVWMAYDIQDKTDVALKVMCLGDWGENEYRIQDEISQNVEDTSHLVMYLGTFLLPGNEPRHRALVYPLMGPCIDFILLRKIPMASRMSAARQLLEALEQLHKAEIVHCDLNERNCMWGMVSLRGLDRSAKYETLGRPLKQTIPFVDLWKKGELVRQVDVPENLRTEEFFLGDFGVAQKLGDSVTQLGFPLQNTVPQNAFMEKIRVLPAICGVIWLYLPCSIFAFHLSIGGLRRME